MIEARAADLDDPLFAGNRTPLINIDGTEREKDQIESIVAGRQDM